MNEGKLEKLAEITCVFGFKPELVKDVVFYDGIRNGKKIQAVKMFFVDGTVTVSSPHNGDTFDPETGMIMCILQYIWGGKQYNNFFRKWIKVNQQRKETIEAEKAVKKAAKEAQIKREADAAKRKAARREAQVEILAEAILRAAKEYKSE